MDDKTIIAALIGAALGYWWATERQKAACKCQQQAAQEVDPLAWLGGWNR